MQHIRANPRNAPTVGGAADLELFQFGGARVDLSAARGALQDVQENRCFYCGSAMKQDPHACRRRDSWTINPRCCRRCLEILGA